MAVELLLPGRRVPAPEPPSRIALNMAFGAGNPAILGDKSRYNSHGAITGAVPAAGVHGYCLDFDPLLFSRVEIPAAHTQLNFTSENWSIVARVIFDAFADNAVILDRGQFNADGYRFAILANGSMRLYTSQLVTQTSGTGAGAIVVATQYTLGMSRNGASVRVYRNGVDITTIVGVHIDPLTCNRVARIGCLAIAVDDLLDGRMEFLRVFGGVALSTSEHLAWHNALV